MTNTTYRHFLFLVLPLAMTAYAQAQSNKTVPLNCKSAFLNATQSCSKDRIMVTKTNTQDIIFYSLYYWDVKTFKKLSSQTPTKPEVEDIDNESAHYIAGRNQKEAMNNKSMVFGYKKGYCDKYKQASLTPKQFHICYIGSDTSQIAALKIKLANDLKNAEATIGLNKTIMAFSATTPSDSIAKALRTLQRDDYLILVKDNTDNIDNALLQQILRNELHLQNIVFVDIQKKAEGQNMGGSNGNQVFDLSNSALISQKAIVFIQSPADSNKIDINTIFDYLNGSDWTKIIAKLEKDYPELRVIIESPR